MRRTGMAVLALLMAIPGTAVADQGEQERTVEIQPIVQESTVDGTPTDGTTRMGRAVLNRTDDGLSAVAHMANLEPGGVYTFWWVVVHDDGTFPDDIFAASGAGVVVGDNGRASIRMTADVGQSGIEGFMPDGVNEIQFADLTDPHGALVRIEVAYHGQAEDAGDDLETWLYDFWTGSACPPETPNPNPVQPHCPVYFAATFG